MNQKLNVNVAELASFVCKACKNDIWLNAMIIKRVSPLQSTDGQEGKIPVPALLCAKCGNIFTDENVEVGYPAAPVQAQEGSI